MKASKVHESTDTGWDQFVAHCNVEEAAEETQTFFSIYQPIPSIEYQISDDEYILDVVSDGEDSQDKFMYEGDEHEDADSEDSEEDFEN